MGGGAAFQFVQVLGRPINCAFTMTSQNVTSNVGGQKPVIGIPAKKAMTDRTAKVCIEMCTCSVMLFVDFLLVIRTNCVSRTAARIRTHQQSSMSAALDSAAFTLCARCVSLNPTECGRSCYKQVGYSVLYWHTRTCLMYQ